MGVFNKVKKVGLLRIKILSINKKVVLIYLLFNDLNYEEYLVLF